MPPRCSSSAKALSWRYLSLLEREEIALCRGATCRRCRGPERRSRSWSHSYVKGRRHGSRARRWAKAWSPGADCPTLAARLPGRQNHAHQPRSHLPGPLRSGPRSAAPRVRRRARALSHLEIMIRQRPPKRPIERCRDIGKGTSSSVLAARRSGRLSSARRASRCYCIFLGSRGIAKLRARRTGLRSRDTGPKPCATRSCAPSSPCPKSFVVRRPGIREPK